MPSGKNKATGKYAETTEDQMRSYVERYAELILELAERRPMTDAVRATFIEKMPLSVVERLAFKGAEQKQA